MELKMKPEDIVGQVGCKQNWRWSWRQKCRDKGWCKEMVL